MRNFEDIVSGLIVESTNPFKGDKKEPVEDLKEFVKKRAAGARKIEQMAEKKGGYSLLTAVHFKAKETPYNAALKHCEDEGSDFIEKKADECFNKLKDWKNLSQRDFQYIMGQLEAYGEVYIRSKYNKKN